LLSSKFHPKDSGPSEARKEPHVLTSEERKVAETIRRIVDGAPLRKGQDWLIQTSLNVDADHGWGVEARRLPITTWGGTVDGIRGLLATGVDLRDPVIVEAEKWLVRKQLHNGSFLARELKWPNVEATAWVLLVLRELKHPLDDGVIQKAVTFLERCIQSDTHGLGTSDRDEVRIYPSAITLWALHGLSREEGLIADFLKTTFNRAAGGWRSTPDGPVNLMMTTYALYTLLVSGHLRRDDDMCRQATAFIYAEISKPNGTWTSATESWHSVYQEDATDPPNQCHHYMVPWVLLTLLAAGESPLDHRVLRVLTRLISDQLASGAWRYSQDDVNEYTWCVANALVAIEHTRSALITPVVNAAIAGGIVKDYGTPVTVASRLRRNLTRENVNTVLTVALFIVVFREPISSAAARTAASVATFLGIQQGSIVSNVVADAITTAFVAILGSLYLLIVTRFRQSSGPSDEVNKE
jgi:hypothetical protein